MFYLLCLVLHFSFVLEVKPIDIDTLKTWVGSAKQDLTSRRHFVGKQDVKHFSCHWDVILLKQIVTSFFELPSQLQSKKYNFDILC